MTTKTKKNPVPRPKRQRQGVVKPQPVRLTASAPDGPPEPDFAAYADQLKKAQESNNFLLAVWYVEGGVLHFHRLTHKFLIGDFPIAVDQLKTSLEAELRPQN